MDCQKQQKLALEIEKINELNLPKVAFRHPFTVDLEPGVIYFYCTCGLSEKQPFCDGKCEGCIFQPLQFTVKRSGKALLCGCKRNNESALYRCDGSHSMKDLEW